MDDLLNNIEGWVKKHYLISCLLFLLVIIFIFIVSAFFFHNYVHATFWPKVVGAVIAVLLTALTTAILLYGQIKAQVRRERDAKVFERKLDIYQIENNYPPQ